MKITGIILYTSLLLKINNCFAQKDTVAAPEPDRFYISLTGGIGIPVGEFAEFGPKQSQSFEKQWPANQNLAGEALPGINGRFNVNYFFLKNIGCAGTLFAGSYKARVKTNDDMEPKINSLSDFSFSYNVKSWTAVGGMIGLIARIPVGKIDFNIRLSGGIQNTVCPETNITLTYNDFYIGTDPLIVVVTQPSVSSSNFAIDGGLDVKFNPFKKISFLFSADYMSSDATFTDEAEIILPPSVFYSNSWPYPFEHTKQISYISLTAGIGYTFK